MTNPKPTPAAPPAPAALLRPVLLSADVKTILLSALYYAGNDPNRPTAFRTNCQRVARQLCMLSDDPQKSPERN